jgi:transposase
MTEKREVIRRLRLGHSIRHINKSTGMHRTLIRRLKDLAQQHLWLESEEPVPDEATIKALLDPPASSSNAEHPLDPYRSDIAKWLKEEYSYVVIHQLLSPMVPVSESTVRRYCQKHFPQAPRGTHLRDTIPGEIMEVDFGQLGMMYDPMEKRSRRVYVFSARLRHSRMAYRQLVFSQKQEVFFMCHVHAFEFFGGVPERVVPDNLKAAVIKASFTDPVVNRVYHRLAEHYGFVIDPCLPYRPRLKGGVENDIKFIKGNFWPLYREHQRRVGNDIPSWEGAGRALEDWGEQVSRRVLSGVGRRPTDLFHHEEADCLKSLPDSRWKPVRWASAKVHETWRVQVGRRLLLSSISVYRQNAAGLHIRFPGRDLRPVHPGGNPSKGIPGLGSGGKPRAQSAECRGVPGLDPRGAAEIRRTDRSPCTGGYPASSTT